MHKHIDIDHPQAVKYAVNVLAKGGVIVYPTDTLYGFGVDATNDDAIDKINLIKERSGPMSVMASDKIMAIGWMAITNKQIDIIEPFLGGARTLIVPVKPNTVSTNVLGLNNALGIRIPDNSFCNKLSFKFIKPIVTTSVNRTHKKPINDPDQIESFFGSEVDLIIDAGTLPKSRGSTIYQFIDNNVTVLRK